MASMSGSAQGQPPIKLRIPVNLEMLKKKDNNHAKVDSNTIFMSKYLSVKGNLLVPRRFFFCIVFWVVLIL